MKWDTELARQKAIEASLNNQERLLDLSSKIKDPLQREEFVRNMARSIAPLTSDYAPKLKQIGVSESDMKETTPIAAG
jgi:hypothetical protein